MQNLIFRWLAVVAESNFVRTCMLKPVRTIHTSTCSLNATESDIWNLFCDMRLAWAFNIWERQYFLQCGTYIWNPTFESHRNMFTRTHVLSMRVFHADNFSTMALVTRLSAPHLNWAFHSQQGLRDTWLYRQQPTRKNKPNRVMRSSQRVSTVWSSQQFVFYIYIYIYIFFCYIFMYVYIYIYIFIDI